MDVPVHNEVNNEVVDTTLPSTEIIPPTTLTKKFQSISDSNISDATNDKINPSPKTTPTTARNKSKAHRIKKDVCGKTTRTKLYQILTFDKQKKSIPTEFPNSAFFYGNVVGGTSAKGWHVK